jgi:hypothetical protein
MVDDPNTSAPEIERLVSNGAADPAALSGLLAAVGPDAKPHPIREASAAALKVLSLRNPAQVLAHWGELSGLLDCDNAFSRTIAVHVIANLAPADEAGRLAAILDRFYDHLGDMVSVAGHVLQVSPQIAAGRPEVRTRITARILDLPRLAKRDRLGLLRSYAIEALDEYLAPVDRTPDVAAFVEAGLTDDSPKTRKLAAEVLRRWGSGSRSQSRD